MTKELIKNLKEHPAFVQYLEYIMEQMAELDTLGGLEGLSNEQAGEEVRARAKAVEKLGKILEPFLELRLKRELTDEEITKARSRYGL